MILVYIDANVTRFILSLQQYNNPYLILWLPFNDFNFLI